MKIKTVQKLQTRLRISDFLFRIWILLQVDFFLNRNACAIYAENDEKQNEKKTGKQLPTIIRGVILCIFFL